MDFATRDVHSWTEFVHLISAQPKEDTWCYRGQRRDWPLATSLERSLLDWEIDLGQGPAIEKQMVRDFRRRYHGAERDRLDVDTLYCPSGIAGDGPGRDMGEAADETAGGRPRAGTAQAPAPVTPNRLSASAR
jgi:hypothetical protein